MCLTRQGSGSACRSIYGGFVAWEKGELADGTDSIAVQVKHIEKWGLTPQLETSWSFKEMLLSNS